MFTQEEIWPPFGLVIRCGDLTLTPVRESDYPEIAGAAAHGVRSDGVRTFSVGWDLGTPLEVARRLAIFHWSLRADFTPARWHIEFTVRRAGTVIGVQGIRADRYPETRAGSTGSWLGKPYQGMGSGTLIRQMLASAFFDHFGAYELYTGYFAGNDASRKVSEKCGYRPNGQRWTPDDTGSASREYALVLTPETLVRPYERVAVSGAENFAEFLGL